MVIKTFTLKRWNILMNKLNVWILVSGTESGLLGLVWKRSQYFVWWTLLFENEILIFQIEILIYNQCWNIAGSRLFWGISLWVFWTCQESLGRISVNRGGLFFWGTISSSSFSFGSILLGTESPWLLSCCLTDGEKPASWVLTTTNLWFLCRFLNLYKLCRVTASQISNKGKDKKTETNVNKWKQKETLCEQWFSKCPVYVV